jgi:DNA-binding NtrC family response regulator
VDSLSNTANRGAGASGKGETVLIIDEDKARLLHEEELVAALGYEPVGFTEAESALAAARFNPDRFDFVLIAHLQPLSKALSAAQKLRAVSTELPVLLVAPTDELGADVLAHAGVCEVLSVPLDSSDLALALQRYLAPAQTHLPTYRAMGSATVSSR